MCKTNISVRRKIASEMTITDPKDFLFMNFIKSKHCLCLKTTYFYLEINDLEYYQNLFVSLIIDLGFFIIE